MAVSCGSRLACAVPVLETYSAHSLEYSLRGSRVACFPNTFHGLLHAKVCRRRQCPQNRPKASAELVEAATPMIEFAGKSEVTWQVVAGSIAGVTPFVVAGVEFSKRIIAQRACPVCEGSGLELVGRFYRKCRECGGFLPWQSWKRFFSG